MKLITKSSSKRLTGPEERTSAMAECIPWNSQPLEWADSYIVGKLINFDAYSNHYIEKRAGETAILNRYCQWSAEPPALA
jgi:hypothetical protein